MEVSVRLAVVELDGHGVVLALVDCPYEADEVET